MKNNVIESLNTFLSDTYILYIKTQNYHWNVVGESFQALHSMFEAQYIDLRDAVDLLAERVRALGGRAAGSCTEFSQLSKIEENTARLGWREMVQDAASDNAAIAKSGREFAHKLEQIGESATGHMILDRVNAHEKAAWMLRSMLG